MKVKATQRGFYDSLREPEDEFVLRDRRDFSPEWMEKVGEPRGKKPSSPKDDNSGDGNDGGDDADTP